jgi:hypothetical protein
MAKRKNRASQRREMGRREVLLTALGGLCSGLVRGLFDLLRWGL